MSFSGQIKEELSHIISSSRHCQLAELAAIIQFCGHVSLEEESGLTLKVQTENQIVARKCFTLLWKTFKIYSSVTVRQNSAQSGVLTYILKLEYPVAEKILEALKLLDANGQQNETMQKYHITDSLLIKNSCCKRAFLRGAYLTVGSMSDPYKGYHLEIVCIYEEQASQFLKILHDFDLDAKMVLRKKYYVVYIKEGENIADFLNIIEAHKALMEFENTRIYKGVRNMVNRKVNCEAANITKTVNAATRQVEDILLIQSVYGLEHLPDNLREIAYARLDNPQATLGELGNMLQPPVGKSGVNHRLRKLGEFAKGLKV